VIKLNELQKSSKDLCNPLRKSWTLKDVEKLITKTKQSLIRGAGNHGNAFLSFGAAWDFTENFSACTTNQCDGLWPSTNTAELAVNTTTDVIDIDVSGIDVDGISHDSEQHYDLGAGIVSDTAFLLRFKFVLSSFTASTVASQISQLKIGLSSVTTIGETPVEDSIGVIFRWVPSTTLIYGYHADGGTATRISTTVVPSATTYYIEIKRLTATTAEVKLFSDSTFTTQLGSTASMTIPSTIQGLRYLKLYPFVQRSTGVFVATFDDVQLMETVSTPP